MSETTVTITSALDKLFPSKAEREKTGNSDFTLEDLTRREDLTRQQAEAILQTDNGLRLYQNLQSALMPYRGLNLPNHKKQSEDHSKLPLDVARLIIMLDAYYGQTEADHSNDLNNATVIGLTQSLAGWNGGRRDVGNPSWGSSEGLRSPSPDCAARIQTDSRFTQLIEQTSEKSTVIDMIFMTLMATQEHYQALQFAAWAAKQYDYPRILAKLSPTLIKLAQVQAGGYNRRLFGALALINDSDPKNALTVLDHPTISSHATEALLRFSEIQIWQWQNEQEVITTKPILTQLSPDQLQNKIKEQLDNLLAVAPDANPMETLKDEVNRLVLQLAQAVQTNRLLASLVAALHPEVTPASLLHDLREDARGSLITRTLPQQEVVASYGSEFSRAPIIGVQRQLQANHPIDEADFPLIIEFPNRHFTLKQFINFLRDPALFDLYLNKALERYADGLRNSRQHSEAEIKEKTSTALLAVNQRLARGLHWIEIMCQRDYADYNILLERLVEALAAPRMSYHLHGVPLNYFKQNNPDAIEQAPGKAEIETDLANLVPQLLALTQETGLSSLQAIAHKQLLVAAQEVLQQMKETLENERQRREQTRGAVSKLRSQLVTETTALERLRQELEQKKALLIDAQEPVSEMNSVLKKLFSRQSTQPETSMNINIIQDKITALTQFIQEKQREISALNKEIESKETILQQSNTYNALQAQLNALQQWITAQTSLETATS